MNESIYFNSEWDEQSEREWSRPDSTRFGLFDFRFRLFGFGTKRPNKKKNQTSTDKLVCTSAILIKQK